MWNDALLLSLRGVTGVTGVCTVAGSMPAGVRPSVTMAGVAMSGVPAV